MTRNEFFEVLSGTLIPVREGQSLELREHKSTFATHPDWEDAVNIYDSRPRTKERVAMMRVCNRLNGIEADIHTTDGVEDLPEDLLTTGDPEEDDLVFLCFYDQKGDGPPFTHPHSKWRVPTPATPARRPVSKPRELFSAFMKTVTLMACLAVLLICLWGALRFAMDSLDRFETEAIRGEEWQGQNSSTGG